MTHCPTLLLDYHSVKPIVIVVGKSKGMMVEIVVYSVESRNQKGRESKQGKGQRDNSSSSRNRTSYTEVMAEALEVHTREGFREYVGCVVFGPNTLDSDVSSKDELSRVVVLDSDVLGVRVPNMVFGQAGCSIVIAVQTGRSRWQEA